MSRRRQGVEFEYIAVDIECPRGHRVGVALRFAGQHPHAGTYATAGGVRFEDVPDPTHETGRVRGLCGECGADVQAAWGRVRQVIDELEAAGRHTGTHRP